MGNLISNYEISVWQDVYTEGAFEEQRICVIGSDNLQTQSKLIEPMFTRNVNGQKSLTFKMYKQYIDNITGQKVINPFSQYLVNEAKVKLWYENKWYDFFIKNIIEDSNTYLYTYQLEDSLVQELSKNGYGVTLDPELMNNTGTLEELGARILEDTGWTITSEKFVEKVVDHLVYVRLTKKFNNVIPILDQTSFDSGVGFGQAIELEANSRILAFYTCCNNKPHRFQFIYLNSYEREDVEVDEDNNIKNSNCQYYIDCVSPKSDYKKSGQFFLPDGMQVDELSDSFEEDLDTTISTWYKGKRFGFAQKTVYVPLLKRYCNLYKKNDVEYYGYVDNEYNSPTLTTDFITNGEFKGTTGWTGAFVGETKNVKSKYAAKVDSVYGRFLSNSFSSVADELRNGTYSENNSYISYLKVRFPTPNGAIDYGVLMNSGFYDNRTIIKQIAAGEKWHFEVVVLDESGSDASSKLSWVLCETTFNTTTGSYTLDKDASWATLTGNTFTFNSRGVMTQKEFEKKNVRLICYPKNASDYNKTYYIQSIKLYKEVKNESGQIIKPGELSTDGVVIPKYSFVKVDDIKEESDVENLNITTINQEDLKYNEYIPQYNSDCQKIRTVQMKESNYFNNLQSLAEKFEAWLEIIAERDPLVPGKIISKKVHFKNYCGEENYAAFRYGVNLNNIQRTFESKALVTKLIVKQNNNELANSGFCTIARAGSNPTGENYIYDFQYFHKMGAIDERPYLSETYYHINPDTGLEAQGPDMKNATTYNLQNYFNRIKKINLDLQPINENISNLTLDLTKLRAEKTLQEGLRDAARDGVEEASDKFFAINEVYPTGIAKNSFEEITCGNEYHMSDLNTSWYTTYIQNSNTPPTMVKTQIGSKNSTQWHFRIGFNKKTTIDFDKSAMGGASLSGDSFEKTSDAEWAGIQIVPKEKYKNNVRYRLSFNLQRTGGTLTTIGSHKDSFKNFTIWYDGVLIGENTDHITVANDGNKHNVVFCGTFFNNTNDSHPYIFIQPNRGLDTEVVCNITDIQLQKYNLTTATADRTFYIKPTFTLKPINGENATRDEKIACKLPAYDVTIEQDYSIQIVDEDSLASQSALTDYITYKNQEKLAVEALGDENSGLIKAINDKQLALEEQKQNRKILLEYKEALNNLFYSKYCRFIQEGTWMSEDHIDDDKYYVDALSVLYNSCYPKVAYNINVLSLSKLPGYEDFKFNLGDKTYAEDPDFFGSDLKVQVTIAEITEDLDDSSKNIIKVQNFKNQFQELFQKMAATVQQTQYNTGAYNKAVELAEGAQELKSQFVADGLNAMGNELFVAGQTTVKQDASGITLTDSATKNQMRLIGGAILMSVEEEGQRKWKTGLTPAGISASLITAGEINTGEISIYNANEPTFIWNSFGITAFDVDWTNKQANGKVNPYKFVRYDKYGIYGIDSSLTSSNRSLNGNSWKPTSIDEIDQEATFALTWEGLKVTGNDGSIARIGRHKATTEDDKDTIINIVDGKGKPTFRVDSDGKVFIKGSIDVSDGGAISGVNFVPAETSTGAYTWTFDTGTGITMNKHNIPVFSVDSSGAFIRGTVTAENGEIAGWLIKPKYLVREVEGEQYGIIIRSVPDNPDIDPVLAIGYEAPKWNATEAPFQVMLNGTVKATQADITGKITAKEGEIGGWTLGEVDLSNESIIKQPILYGKTTSSSGVGMAVVKKTTAPAFWAGYSGEGNTPWADSGWETKTTFFIRGNGSIHSTAGDIGGWLIENSGIKHYGTNSGEAKKVNMMIRVSDTNQAYTVGSGIGKYDWRLYFGGNNSSVGNFGVDSIGKLYASGADISGTITATGGKIGGWTLGTEDMYFRPQKVNDKEQMITSFIRGDGNTQARYSVGDSGYLQNWRLWFGGTTKDKDSGYNEGKFGVTNTGQMYAVDAILTGELTSTGKREGQKVQTVIKDGEYRQVGVSTDIKISGSQIVSTGRNTIYSNNELDTRPYGVYQSYYLPWQLDFRYRLVGETEYTRVGGIQIGNDGIPTWDSDYDICSFFGTWNFPNSASATSTDSDINLKHSISLIDLDSRYEILFDLLSPSTFKYIKGKSDRIHTGFIVQSILSAMTEAKLSTQEFAAVCLREEGDGGYWGLRYEEIIPLNTWQIQKLKPRMTAAELEIVQLKEKITLLESQIENLKNT